VDLLSPLSMHQAWAELASGVVKRGISSGPAIASVCRTTRVFAAITEIGIVLVRQHLRPTPVLAHNL